MPSATRHLFAACFALLCLGATGCAHSYDAIEADRLAYRNTQEQEGVEFSYRYNALRNAGNENYADEATEENISVVAVRVVNGTDDLIVLNPQTLRVEAGGVPIGFAPTEPIVSEVQQRVWPYSFYSLIFVNISSDGEGVTLPVGVGIALFNIVRGVQANNQLEDEFEEDELLGQEVGPGETAYGLVYLRDADLEPLTFALATAP